MAYILFLMLTLALNTQFRVYAFAESCLRRTSYASRPSVPTSTVSLLPGVKRQQVASRQSTCGFKDGDPNSSRTADPGFDCRVDTLNGLWGFCPTTVIAATDCGLAGNCIDVHACRLGCGTFGNTQITTFTCTSPGADFCSSAFLTAGVDQTYVYIACGPNYSIENLLATTTANSLQLSTSSASNTPTIVVSSSIAFPSTPSITSFSSLTPSSSPSTSPASFTSTPATPANDNATTLSDSGSSSTSSSSASDNTGAIVGGVIGGAALLFFVGIALLFLRKYNARSAETRDRPPAQSDPTTPVASRINVMTKNPFWRRTQATTPSELPGRDTTTLPPAELPGYP